MKKHKLTPWFPGDVQPKHEGLYEVVRPYVLGGYPKNTFLSWKKGEWRHTQHSSINRFPNDYAHMDCTAKWRGLAVKP